MITGRCECGSVTYRVDGKVEDFSHCHCSMCRRLHGATYVSFAGVARNDFSYLSGEENLAHYKSSEDHDRVFCRVCGSNILTDLTSEPDSVYISLGTVDGDPELPPGYHIYVGSKAPWHVFNDRLPQYDQEPEYDKD